MQSISLAITRGNSPFATTTELPLSSSLHAQQSPANKENFLWSNSFEEIKPSGKPRK
jgi:hypothetical protein